MEPKEKPKTDEEEAMTTWGDIRVWVSIILIVIVTVIVVLIILGPTIGNIFSNIIVGLQ